MAETKFEQDYGIDLDAPNLNVVQAVEVGIEIEKRGEQYYFDSAKNVSNEELRRFLEFLGRQETEHFEILNELKQSLKEREQWIETPKKLEQPEIFRKGKTPLIKEGSEDLEILTQALEVENQTRDYYRKFAENIDDPVGRHFFEKLADFEQGHAEMIQDMMDIRAESHIET